MEASENAVAGAAGATDRRSLARIAARGEGIEREIADGRVSWRRAIAIWIGAALLGWALIAALVAGILRLAGAI